MAQPIWLALAVNPEPWAIGPVGVRRNGGRLSAFVGQNRQLKAFQEAVASAVREQWGDLPMLEGKVEFTVYLWRQRSEYTTPSDRKHRKHEADSTNMLKAIEDACQGILFGNDRDNISVASHIMEQDAETTGKIVLKVRQVDPNGHRYILMAGFPPHIVTTLGEYDRAASEWIELPPYEGPEVF